MQTERGRFVRGTETLTDEVSIRLSTSNFPTPNTWAGQFTLPPGVEAELGVCRVELADGRAGDVMLYRLDAGAERTIVVNFRGIGLLKKAG